MCGRYAITLPPEAVRQWFQTQGEIPNWPVYYNAAPTIAPAATGTIPRRLQQPLPAVRLHPSLTTAREPAPMYWLVTTVSIVAIAGALALVVGCAGPF